MQWPTRLHLHTLASWTRTLESATRVSREIYVVAKSDVPVNRIRTPSAINNLFPAAVGIDGRVNLFVGNVSSSGMTAWTDGQLPYRVRWQDLKDLFRRAGTVLRADVSLGQDNRSRGYGTVLMGSREDGAKAIGVFASQHH